LAVPCRIPKEPEWKEVLITVDARTWAQFSEVYSTGVLDALFLLPDRSEYDR